MTDGKNQNKGYAIGYCRPPLNSRFKKGACPNPKGRGRPKFVDVGLSLEILLAERVKITIGGKTKAVTRQEAQLWGLVREAMSGKLGAAELVVDLLTVKEKKRGRRALDTRYEDEVMRDIAGGRLPRNTIIRRDLLEKYATKKED